MITIALVDDHPVVVDGLSSLLSRQEGLRLKGAFTKAHELYSLLERESLDLALVDISMPGIDGIDVIRHIKESHPQTRILVLSMHRDEGLLRQIMNLGVEGYLKKDASANQILEAIRRVHHYGVFLDHETSELLVNALRKDSDSAKLPDLESAPAEIPSLSKRELQVVELVAMGQSVHGIAEEMNISFNTVKSHKKNIFRKLEVRSNAELVNMAHKMKLI